MFARLWRKRRPSVAPERQPEAAAAAAPAWRDAPPMGLLPPLRPATPSLAFASSLPSRRPSQRMLEPLGHDVAADGPGGLLFGIATPLTVVITADAVTARLTSVADLPMRRVEPPRRVETAASRGVSVARPVTSEAREPRRIVAVDDAPADALPILRRADEQRDPEPHHPATRALTAEEPIARAQPAPADEQPRDDAPGDAIPAPRAAGRHVRGPGDEAPAPSVRAPRDEAPAQRDEPRAPRDDAPPPRAVKPTARPLVEGAPPARAESDPRITQPPGVEPIARSTSRGEQPRNEPLDKPVREPVKARGEDAHGDDRPARAADKPQIELTARDAAPPAAEQPVRSTPSDPPRSRTTRPLRGLGEPLAHPTPRDAAPPARAASGTDPGAQPPRVVTRPARARAEAPPVRDDAEPIRDEAQLVRDEPLAIRDEAWPIRAQAQPTRDEVPTAPGETLVGRAGEPSVVAPAARPAGPAGEPSVTLPAARPAGLGAPIVPRTATTPPRPPLRAPVPAVQRAEAGPRRLPATDPAPEAPPRPPAATHIRTLLGARGLHVQRASEPVPAEVRTSLEPQLGVDLSGLRVHRGEESSRFAEALDARAFTVGGEVHVPASQGSLTSGSGQALLAHELVHVAQQRKLGPNLPEESSPQGRELESEARAMEQTWLAPASVVPSVPLLSPAAAPAAAAPAPAIPEPLQAPAAPADAPKSPQAPVPAPAGPDIEQLTATLYDRVRSLLRNELRVDRERAGLFTDVR
jgi:hypothetical protein